MKTSNKSKRGGRREGAGRKPLAEGESNVMYCGRVPESIVDRVDAARGDSSRSEVLRNALGMWLKRHG